MKTLDRFLKHWEDSLANGTFVRATLSGPRQADGEFAERLKVRPIALQGKLVLSVTSVWPRRDETQNHPPEKFLTLARGELESRYRNALLCTRTKDWQYKGRDAGEAHLQGHPPSQTEAPNLDHDSRKPTLLDERAHDWLAGLGILTPTFHLKTGMADKHRQIHRYLEILSHHLQPADSQCDEPISVVDMGSGKGYLTFAIWHWLSRIQSKAAAVIGIEERPGLVDASNRLAADIGATGLSFRCGTIAESELPRNLHALVALHACNTATDDAILRGVQAEARHILVAPCCHQDLRSRLASMPPWNTLFEHGMLKERFAEWLTDGLRALYLQAAGYEVTVMEFVASEHTPKNLLLCGRRGTTDEARGRALGSLRELEQRFGILNHPLRSLLSSNIAPCEAGSSEASPDTA